MTQAQSDEYWLQQAVQLAQRAQSEDEVPVGALIVQDNQVIAQGWNQPIGRSDPSAHAEMNALRQAGQYLNNYRLLDTTLYVTLEPCIMCAGAIVHARVKRVVFGAYDPKAGACGSICNVFALNELNHRVDYQGGLLAETCANLLTQFFRARR